MKKLLPIVLFVLTFATARAQVLDTVLRHYVNTYRTDAIKAQRILDDGVAYAEKHGDTNEKATLLVKYIALHTHLRDFKEAYKRFEAARQYAIESKEFLQLACAYNEIAETFHYQENYKASLAYFGKADSVFTKIGDKIGMVISKNNKGDIYQLQGKYDKAIANYLLAIKDIDTTQYRYIKVQMYNNVAALYLKLSNTRKAEYYTKKAIGTAFLDRKWHPENLIAAKVALAEILLKKKDYEGSQRELETAEKLCRQPGLERQRVTVLQGKSALLMAQERNAEAMTAIKEALQIARKFKLNASETFILRSNQAKLYAANQEPDKALQINRELLGHAAQTHQLQELAQAYKDLAETYNGNGDYKKAFENQVLYAKYNDSLLGKEKQQFFQNAEVRYETAKKEKELAQNKVKLLESRSEAERKGNLVLVLGILVIFVGLAGVMFYRQQVLKNRQKTQEFELKNAIAQIEMQQQLQEQRLSISRDLHDNIGAQLTFIISSVDAVKYAYDVKNPAIENRLEQISDFTKETIVELRDTIWAMNSPGITFEDLRSRIYNFVEKARASVPVEFRFAMEERLVDSKLTSMQGMNLYRIIQEAVNNAVKHARANHIHISIVQAGNRLEIEVADDGIGFDPGTQNQGSGLRNMKKRVAEMQGELQLDSGGTGTRVTLTIPMPEGAESL